MNALHLSALDTLFFKDGKPFSLGDETAADGVFPPFPSVFYGALRSLYFASHLDAIAKANEQGDETAALQIKGLLPTVNNELHFPIPNDLYGEKHKAADEAKRLRCLKTPPELISDYACEYLLQTQDVTKVEELGGKALLNQTDFESYLAGNTGPFPFTRMNDVVLTEPKVGIGRNLNTRTTEPAQLYRVGMRRLHSKIEFDKEEEKKERKKFGFALRYESLDLPESGLSRFGAEIKAVEYAAYAGSWNVLCPVHDNAKEFKIYLATPAVFDDGFYPAGWFADKRLTLLAAAFGRVLHIGGFDMKEAKPKAMRKAVPAGTVYYVRAEKGFTDDLKNALHGGSIYNLADTNDAMRKEFMPKGFGLSYVGNFNVENSNQNQ